MRNDAAAHCTLPCELLCVQELLRYMETEGEGAIPFDGGAMQELMGAPATSLRAWLEEHRHHFT